MSWYSLTLTSDTDLTARHTDILTLSGDSNWTEKHVLAKNELGRRLKMDLLPAYEPNVIRVGNDASYIATGTDVTTNVDPETEDAVEVGHRLDILSGYEDAGSYVITAMASGVFTVASGDGTAASFAETRSNVAFQIRPDILDMIADPLGSLKEVAVAFALYYVWSDLATTGAESYEKARDRVKKEIDGEGGLYQKAKNSLYLVADGRTWSPFGRRSVGIPLVR